MLLACRVVLHGNVHAPRKRCRPLPHAAAFPLNPPATCPQRPLAHRSGVVRAASSHALQTSA